MQLQLSEHTYSDNVTEKRNITETDCKGPVL